MTGVQTCALPIWGSAERDRIRDPTPASVEADQSAEGREPFQDVRQERPDFMHGAETLEYGREATVLDPCLLGVRKVVVQVGFARRRRDAKQLGAGRVDEDGPEAPDLRIDMHTHDPKITRRCDARLSGMYKRVKTLPSGANPIAGVG